MMRRYHWGLLTGGGLLLMGLAAIFGWLTQQPALVRLLPNSNGMPYATAAGFVLTGALLIAAWCQSESRCGLRYGKGVSEVLAILLIVLGVGALLESQAGIRLGLSPDARDVQQWFGDASFVCKMRPLAALSFISIGVIGLLLPAIGNLRAFVASQIFALLVMFVGGVGIMGHLAGFGIIFGWYLGPVLSASIGFALCGLSFSLLVRQDSAYRSGSSDESGKIGLLTGAIVVATGLGGILGGFAVLYPQAVGELHNNLQFSLKSRGDVLENAIRQGWRDSYTFGHGPLLLNAMGRVNQHPAGSQAHREIQTVAERYDVLGFSGVLFRDAAGRELARAGAFVADPELSVAVATPSPSELLWRQGFVLHAHIDMVENGRLVGHLEAERRLSVGDDLHDTATFDPSLDLGICASVGSDTMDCFPLRSTAGKVLHQIPTSFAGRPLPMSYALAGKTGMVQTTDYRGIQVIAAYRPLGSLGLGTVIKIDAVELYEPIARRLGPLFVMLLAVAAAAVVLVRIQVVPLARIMAREIEERKRAEASQLRLSASLRRLSEIATWSHLPSFDQFHRALAVGAEHFGLEFGIVSRIQGDRYEVVAQISPSGTLEDGQVFPLGATYCSITLAEKGVVAISQMGTSAYIGHPCYRELKLETYIGAPIMVGDEVFGTVNFSSSHPFHRDFDDGDREFMALLARWAGSAIERHRINEALRQSERRVRAILDASDESVLLLAADGRALAINACGARRFGEEANALVGRDVFALMPPELAASRRAALDHTFAAGEPIHAQDQRQGVFFDNSFYPVKDESGRVESVAVHTKDITEAQRAKQVEDAFRHLDTVLLKWRMGMEAIAQIFCDDLLPVFNLRAVWIGRAEDDGRLAILAGAGEGCGFLDRFKENGLRWNGEFNCCLPAGEVIRSGNRRQLQDGEPDCRACWEDNGIRGGVLLPIRLRGAAWGVLALYGPDPGWLASAHNSLDAIANRLGNALESAIQQEWLALLDSALAGVGNAVLITDAKARILWANQSLAKLTGYGIEEIIGNTPRLFHSGRHDAGFFKHFWETIQAGRTWRGEMVNARRDGSLYTVGQTVTPLLDANSRVTNYFAIVEDISERKAMEERIRHAASFDLLTDLPNRGLFFDRLGQGLAQARRDGHGLALLFLDLDRFKEVNDTLGHEAGDLLLKAVAERLRGQVRETDTVARLAGDEFTVILPRVASADDAIVVAEKIITAISAPFDLKGKKANIGVSIGVALFPNDGDTIELILSAADKAMYQAKQAGRNTLRVCH